MAEFHDTPSSENSTCTTDLFLWLIPFALCIIGAVMIFSLTLPDSISRGGVLSSHLGMRQLQWITLGLVSMVIMYLFPLSFWKRTSGVLWIFAVMLTFVTLIHGLGFEAGGAKRWIRIAGFRVQPLEFLSLAFVIHLAKILSDEGLKRKDAFTKLLVIMGVSIIPVILQPDLGGSILLFLIGMAMFVERKGWLLPLLTGGMMLPVLLFLIFGESYRLRRYIAFMDPWKDPLDKGFQVIQGLVAFSNGGVLGAGIGKGLQKLNYLPAAHTDFIFAALGEEFGLLGTGGVTFLFSFWTYRIYGVYRKTNSGYIKVFVWGLCISILLPFFINIAGVTKLIPLTGMPLPFVSYGGSSLVTSWMSIGILLRCSRDAVMGKDLT